MKINLIAVGKNMPTWVSDGYQEYAKRMPADFKLDLIEIPMPKRLKNSDIKQIQQKESNKILAAITKGSLIIALDEHGQQLSSINLAKQLKIWQESWPQISLLIGGPDGLAKDCLIKAHYKWSLSALTFPHPLVRIIIAEQLYRAVTILHNHPYHRA